MLNRRSIRLKNYDYSQGGRYFITICCQDRTSLFGKIDKGEMILNEAGKMIASEWLALKNRFPNIELDEYIVMPNHFHGILRINDKKAIVPSNNTVGASLVDVQNNNNNNNKGSHKGIPQQQPQGISPTDINPTVGNIIGAFKSITSVEYIRGIKTKNWEQFNNRLWQRNYWEHIIRNDDAFDRISQYIKNNPRKWSEDKLNNAK